MGLPGTRWSAATGPSRYVVAVGLHEPEHREGVEQHARRARGAVDPLGDGLRGGGAARQRAEDADLDGGADHGRSLGALEQTHDHVRAVRCFVRHVEPPSNRRPYPGNGRPVYGRSHDRPTDHGMQSGPAAKMFVQLVFAGHVAPASLPAVHATVQKPPRPAFGVE